MSKDSSLLACLGFSLIILPLVACSQTTTSEPPNMIAHLPTGTTVRISTESPTPTRSVKPRKTRVPVNAATEQSQELEERYTLTPSPTPTPTPTTTPVPPLVAHEWTTEPILLRFGQIGGDGADPLDYTLPSLTLYSDGRLFFRQWENLNQDDLRVKLWEAVLSRQEMCALLNAIDQTGFLDYDSSTYLPEGEYLPFDGASDTVIEVDSWRSRHISLNGLWVFLNDEPSMARGIVFGGSDYGTLPYIPAALRNVYRLLTHYRPENVYLYQPHRLALRLVQPELYYSSTPWPLKSPKLSELYKRSNAGQDFVITMGAETAAIFEVFDNSMDANTFDENTDQYFVAMRPLLPYESLSSDYAFSPVNAPAEFRRPMHCEPSDGVLSTP